MRRFFPLIDQAFVSGGSFLTIVISAHLLPVSEQGKLGYIIAMYLGVVVFNTTLLFQWASVRAPQVKDKINFWRTLASFQLIVGLLLSVFACLIITVLGKESGWNVTLIDIASIFTFIFFQQLTDFDRRTSYIFFSAKRAVKISSLVYIPRIVLFIVMAPSNIAYITLIMILTAFIPAARVVRLGLNDCQNFAQVISFIRNQPASVKWLMVSGPLVWAAAAIPTYFLGVISGMAAVGVFITVRSLSTAMNVVMELLETEVSARAGRLYTHHREAFVSLFRNVRMIGYSLWAIGAVLMTYWGNNILNLIYGESYSDYQELLLLLWFATGVTFAFRVKAVELRTLGKSRSITLAYFVATVVMLLFAYPLIIMYDEIGAALLICLGVITNYLFQLLISKLPG